MITRRSLYAPIVHADAELDWEMANSIQVTPAEPGGEQHHLGVVTARPHATGWFVSARCRHGLDRAEARTFKQFVATQVYWLLQEGPHRGAWTPGESDEEWRAHAVVGTAGAPAHVPDLASASAALNAGRPDTAFLPVRYL